MIKLKFEMVTVELRIFLKKLVPCFFILNLGVVTAKWLWFRIIFDMLCVISWVRLLLGC